MQRIALASVVVFVFVFLFEFLFHGILLKGMYEATAELWRPEEEHEMIYLFLSQLWFAIMVVVIFSRNCEGKGVGEGVRYGILIGLLMAAPQLATYCYLPMPLSLTLSWVVASALKGLGAGIVASLVYRTDAASAQG